MTDFKARLYLDWDGVVNADKPRFDDADSFLFPKKKGRGLKETHKFTYSPTVVNTLDRFRTEYDVELVWNSTWNENLDILRVAEKLGALDDGRVLPAVINRYVDTNRQWTQWKADALLADQRGDALPFAWVDDMALEFHGKDVVTATTGTHSLLVEPREYWGITQAHLDNMEKFFASL